MAEDIVAVRRVATADNPADVFTKPLDRVVFNKHASKLMYKGAADGRATEAFWVLPVKRGLDDEADKYKDRRCTDDTKAARDLREYAFA